MIVKWEGVVIDSQDHRALGRWWAEALSWDVIHESDEEFEVCRPDGSHPTLLFINVPEKKSLKNRLHLDFIPDDQKAEVDRFISLGARRVDIGQGETSWVVMADPEGNEFCILSARPES